MSGVLFRAGSFFLCGLRATDTALMRRQWNGAIASHCLVISAFTGMTGRGQGRVEIIACVRRNATSCSCQTSLAHLPDAVRRTAMRKLRRRTSKAPVNLAPAEGGYSSMSQIDDQALLRAGAVGRRGSARIKVVRQGIAGYVHSEDIIHALGQVRQLVVIQSQRFKLR